MYFRIVLKKQLTAAKLIYWQDELFRNTRLRCLLELLATEEIYSIPQLSFRSSTLSN